MPKTEITDEVLTQLADAVESDRVDDPHNRFAVQSVALDEGYEELATFVLESDAVRFTRALELLGARER